MKIQIRRSSLPSCLALRSNAGPGPLPLLVTSLFLVITPDVASGQTTNLLERPFQPAPLTPALSMAELAQATNASAIQAALSMQSMAIARPSPLATSPAASGMSQMQSRLVSTSHLLNINFGAGREKIGPAAVGQSANDFWNWANTLYQDPFTMSDLAWSDGSNCGAALEIDNGRGLYGNDSPDPMYDSYIYPWNIGGISVWLTGIPEGIYDVFIYGHGPAENANGLFELWVNDTSYGWKGTSIWGPGWNSTNWECGQ